jgi:hypothetical protein
MLTASEVYPRHWSRPLTKNGVHYGAGHLDTATFVQWPSRLGPTDKYKKNKCRWLNMVLMIQNSDFG